MLDELSGTWKATVTYPTSRTEDVTVTFCSDGTYTWLSPRITEYGTWTWGGDGADRWITQRPMKARADVQGVTWLVLECTKESLTLGWRHSPDEEPHGLTYRRL